MKLNKKLEIALNAVTALKSKTSPTRTEDLAIEIGTTVNFLEQIMRQLRIAGVVTVKRGPGGGHSLDTTTEVTAYKVAMAVGRDFGVLRFDESPTSRLNKALIEAFTSTKI